MKRARSCDKLKQTLAQRKVVFVVIIHNWSLQCARRYEYQGQCSVAPVSAPH